MRNGQRKKKKSAFLKSPETRQEEWTTKTTLPNLMIAKLKGDIESGRGFFCYFSFPAKEK